MIGIDTTAVIDLFKGDAEIKKLLERVKEPIVSTQLNYLELMFGIDVKNPKRAHELEYYEEFFDEVQPFPLDRQASRKSSEIFWKLKKEGKQIGKFDCIISGILLTHGANKIITRNVKDFGKVPGLKVINY